MVPHNINMMHYFAARNHGECMARCFELKMKYIRDVNGMTPLGYASAGRAIDSIQEIVKYLCVNKKA